MIGGGIGLAITIDDRLDAPGKRELRRLAFTPVETEVVQFSLRVFVRIWQLRACQLDWFSPVVAEDRADLAEACQRFAVGQPLAKHCDLFPSRRACSDQGICRDTGRRQTQECGGANDDDGYAVRRPLPPVPGDDDGSKDRSSQIQSGESLWLLKDIQLARVNPSRDRDDRA